jgi:hypothetical protein
MHVADVAVCPGAERDDPGHGFDREHSSHLVDTGPAEVEVVLRGFVVNLDRILTGRQRGDQRAVRMGEPDREVGTDHPEEIRCAGGSISVDRLLSAAAR